MKRVQRLLLQWYARHGRSLPWRATRDPYRVLVSESMLAQTQVARVLPKYEAFIARFPDVESLAAASTAEILRLWQGLGYNSRAVRLKQLAVALLERFGGRVPQELHELQSLPGIGPYTACAVRAFAFDADDAAVDTNVRRVVHRVLYGMEHPAAVPADVLNADARGLVPRGRGHDWNSALMDLGAAVCTARAPGCRNCPLRSACSAFPIDTRALQARRRRNARAPSPQQAIAFEQTIRYARGRIVDRLARLAPYERISLLDLHADVAASVRRDADAVRAIVTALAREGLVELRGEQVALAQ